MRRLEEDKKDVDMRAKQDGDKEVKLKRLEKELQTTSKRLEMSLSREEANEASFSTLNNELSEKKNQLFESQKQLRNEKAERKIEVEIQTRKINGEKQGNEELLREIEKQFLQTKDQAGKIEILKKQNDEKRKEVDALTHQKNELDKKCQKYVSELGERIKDNGNLASRLDDMELHETQKDSTLCETMLTVEELKEKLSIVENENKGLQTKLENTTKENQEQKNIRKKAETDLQENKKKVDELEGYLKDNNEMLKNNETIFKQYSMEVKGLGTKLVEKTNLADELKNQNEEFLLELQKEKQMIENIKEEHRKELSEFIDRDEEHRTLLDKLLKKVEGLQNKAELANQLSHDCESLREIDSKQSNVIKELETDLKQKHHDVLEKEEKIEKLTDKAEEADALKLENKKISEWLKQNQTKLEDLQSELDESLMKLSEKQIECNNDRVNLNLSYETNGQLELCIGNLRNKNGELELMVEQLDIQVENLSNTLGECLEKQKNDMERLNRTSEEKVRSIQDELSHSKNMSQDELHELLNNFGELENELSFCQEELLSKSNESTVLRKELKEVSKSYSSKEKKLVRDLETLNEQNEFIVQNKVKKCRSECEVVLMDMKRSNSKEMNILQNEFQAKLSLLKECCEESKRNELDDLIKKNNEKVMVLSAERDCFKEKLKRKTDEHEKDSSDSKRMITDKETDLIAKAKIIEKLRRRIETQQKMIDYVKRSLEEERNKEKDSNEDVKLMLSDLQMQLNEKFEAKNDISFSNTDMYISPSASPVSSPMRELVAEEEFIPFVASSPEPNNKQIIPWMNEKPGQVEKYFDSQHNSTQRLYRSMPETYFHDINRPLYFADQIRAIAETSERLASTTCDNPKPRKLDLEVWKQRIHYRLKVIENNLNETGRSTSTIMDDNGATPPGYEKIRELIKDVNKKYKHLSNPDGSLV